MIYKQLYKIKDIDKDHPRLKDSHKESIATSDLNDPFNPAIVYYLVDVLNHSELIGIDLTEYESFIILNHAYVDDADVLPSLVRKGYQYPNGKFKTKAYDHLRTLEDDYTIQFTVPVTGTEYLLTFKGVRRMVRKLRLYNLLAVYEPPL